MIDISSKDVVERTATASGEIKLKESTLDKINRKETKKGDVIETARVAGMQAAKRTWDTIPYCHQIPISSVNLEFNTQRDSIKVRCSVKAVYKTGVEMVPGKFGAVISIERVRNPIIVAREVMEKSPHVIIAGDGAVVATGIGERGCRQPREHGTPFRTAIRFPFPR